MHTVLFIFILMVHCIWDWGSSLSRWTLETNEEYLVISRIK
jgi:hypothetical protein